jgi:protein TonB
MDTLPATNSSRVAAPDDTVFEVVEFEATFPGEMAGWSAFLEANLNGAIPVKRKAPVGNFTVVVQFIVDQTGKISALKALTAHGFGMEAEVLRVMRKSPRWIPAVQNGRRVKAYRKQPVTFAISDK